MPCLTFMIQHYPQLVGYPDMSFKLSFFKDFILFAFNSFLNCCYILFCIFPLFNDGNFFSSVSSSLQFLIQGSAEQSLRRQALTIDGTHISCVSPPVYFPPQSFTTLMILLCQIMILQASVKISVTQQPKIMSECRVVTKAVRDKQKIHSRSDALLFLLIQDATLGNQFLLALLSFLHL